ncbi:MAG: cyclase family protein [Bdellovibrionota bacterium]
MSIDTYKMIDISPIVHKNTPVFPGDVPFSRDVSLSFEKGDHLTLSSMRSTLHIGSHVDAPNHYHLEGEGIDCRALSYYYGKVQVIDLSRLAQPRVVEVGDISEIELISPRVLFKTSSFDHYGAWSDDFTSLSKELISYLHNSGVITVGIDTPSIDAADSKGLYAHQAVYENNMAILEGVDLNFAQAGVYMLVALPLKLKGADASPVRAVLIPLKAI